MGKKSGKNVKSTGKVREFLKRKKVGTLYLVTVLKMYLYCFSSASIYSCRITSQEHMKQRSRYFFPDLLYTITKTHGCFIKCSHPVTKLACILELKHAVSCLDITMAEKQQYLIHTEVLAMSRNIFVQQKHIRFAALEEIIFLFKFLCS